MNKNRHKNTQKYTNIYSFIDAPMNGKRRDANAKLPFSELIESSISLARLAPSTIYVRTTYVYVPFAHASKI